MSQNKRTKSKTAQQNVETNLKVDPDSFATVLSKKQPKDVIIKPTIITNLPIKISIGSESITNSNSNTSQHRVQIKGVVNVKKQELIKLGYDDFLDWASNKNNIYVGRDMSYYVPGAVGSVWGNPFPVAKPNTNNTQTSTRYTLDESLRLFRQHIESSPELIKRLSELDGKVLGCWCKPSRCHGDILKELVEKYCN